MAHNTKEVMAAIIQMYNKHFSPVLPGCILLIALALGSCHSRQILTSPDLSRPESGSGEKIIPRQGPGTGGSESDNPENRSSPPDFAESRPRVLIRDELTAVFSKSELELDFRKSYMASEAQLFTAIYEGLFSYHPFTMEPVPAAAEKWVISDDKKQWTFTIRQEAKFWNGDPLRADDFRNAWISLLSPQQNSPYSSLFDVIAGAREYRMGIEKNPDKVGIKAVDAKTLVVELNNPASFFSAMLCRLTNLGICVRSPSMYF